MRLNDATPEEWDRLKHTTRLECLEGRISITYRGKHFGIDADTYPELRDFLTKIQDDHLEGFPRLGPASAR